jgi:type II secretory pathway pseudopilin PulG
MQKYFLKTIYAHDGFTILETIFALTIFSLALISLMTIAGRGIVTTSNASRDLVAQYLNQETIEIIRWRRDQNIIDSAVNPTISWLEGVDGTAGTADCTVGACQFEFAPGNNLPLFSPCLNRVCTSHLYENQGVYGWASGGGIDTGFIRSFSLIYDKINKPDEVLIDALTQWEEHGVTRSVSLRTVLKKW